MRPVQTIGNVSSNGGELDLFEWQSQTPNMFIGTAHVWENGVDIANNDTSNSSPVPGGTDFANYNTYGVLWTPTGISWYLNNVLMETISTTSAPYSTAFGASQSYFLILGEQAGCNWIYSQTVSCPGQVSPLNMQVQWVHVYQSPAI
jgi:beta-glucanase (GH16 family)